MLVAAVVIATTLVSASPVAAREAPRPVSVDRNTLAQGQGTPRPPTQSPRAQAPTVPRGSDPEQEIDRILDDPAYDGVTATGLLDRLREFWDWLRDAAARLLTGEGGSGPAWGGIVLLVLLLAALAWAVVRGGRIARDRRAELPIPEAELGPDDWDQRARLAAGGGDLDAAIHHAFRALALRHGILVRQPDLPGRTAGEVRRAAAGTANGLLVARAADAFEAVAYGGREATRADLAAIEEANAALRSARPIATAGVR